MLCVSLNYSGVVTLRHTTRFFVQIICLIHQSWSDSYTFPLKIPVLHQWTCYFCQWRLFLLFFKFSKDDVVWTEMNYVKSGIIRLAKSFAILNCWWPESFNHFFEKMSFSDWNNPLSTVFLLWKSVVVWNSSAFSILLSSVPYGWCKPGMIALL